MLSKIFETLLTRGLGGNPLPKQKRHPLSLDPMSKTLAHLKTFHAVSSPFQDEGREALDLILLTCLSVNSLRILQDLNLRPAT